MTEPTQAQSEAAAKAIADHFYKGWETLPDIAEAALTAAAQVEKNKADWKVCERCNCWVKRPLEWEPECSEVPDAMTKDFFGSAAAEVRERQPKVDLWDAALPTQAQIDAAARAIWLDAGTHIRGQGEWTWENASQAIRDDWMKCAKIALTAAAQVRDVDLAGAYKIGYKDGVAAAIERCAQVAKEAGELHQIPSTWRIIAAIRALATEITKAPPHCPS